MHEEKLIDTLSCGDREAVIYHYSLDSLHPYTIACRVLGKTQTMRSAGTLKHADEIALGFIDDGRAARRPLKVAS